MHNQDCPYIHSIKMKKVIKKKWSDSATQTKWLWQYELLAFEMPLVKSKMITTKTLHKKTHARMIQWKWASVLCGARGWTSSYYSFSSLGFHKTLKPAEVSKIFLFLYFSMIGFQLVITGGVFIFTSWCWRLTPGWRYTVTSLRNKYQSLDKSH